MKISAKTKDCRLLVKVKTSFHETIDEKELDRFGRVFLRCFLKPKLLKKNLIEYSGPVGITLQDRMKKAVTKREFLFILEHIVVAVQKLQANNFPMCNLKMGTQHIYINESTRELQFLYIPVLNVSEHTSIIELLNTVIYSVYPAQENDMEYVSRFKCFFDGLRPFDVEKIEQFIYHEDRSVVNTIKKHNAGQSGFMTSKQKHYYDHMDAQENNNDGETDPQDDDDPTGLLTEDDDATGLLQESDNDDATGLLQESDNDDATGLLIEEEEDDATGLLVEEEKEEEGTALLVEDMPTEETVVYPELVRVLTGEIIKINKPVFRIGKERSYVDYFVSDNNAVSRSHADIITRESSCFVIDLNSKNRTYINGEPLTPHQETGIADGCALRLGNEEFVFHAGKAAGISPTCPNCRAQIKTDARFCIQCGAKL